MKKNYQEFLPWLLALGTCMFYCAFHSTFYNFDGVACAVAIELGDFSHLVHGNHLAYGLLGWAFDRLWRVLGYQGMALLPLQTLNSLLGAAGIGVFCSLLLRQRIGRRTAILASLALAVSQAYWFWSLEAQVYMLGALFLLLAAREALAEKPRPALLGFYHAAAILGHVGHIMFAPAALYLIWTARKSKKDIKNYGAVLGLVLLAAYGSCAIFFVRPHSWQACRIWLLGSAALNFHRSFAWHGSYSLGSLKEWVLMSVRIFVDPTLVPGLLGFCGWILAIAALALALWGFAQNKHGSRRRLAITALLWLCCYGALYLSWEPATVVYRITDLIPLWLLAAMAVENDSPRLSAWLTTWILVAGAYNYRTNISPNSDPKNNKPYQEALLLAKETPPESWIAAAGLDVIYVPYFSHRQSLNMHYYSNSFAFLQGKLDQIAATGAPIFIKEDTFSQGNWRPFFEAYGLEPVKDSDGFLWRIKRREKPKGINKRTEE